METLVKHFLTATFTLATLFVYSQEYDDLYYNRKDRKKSKKAASTTVSVSQPQASSSANPSYSSPAQMATSEEVLEQTSQTSFLGRQYNYDKYATADILDENESTVDPELIDYYKKKSIAAYQDDAVDTLSSLSYSNPLYSILDDNYQAEEPIVINNYYGSTWDTPNNNWSMGFGWNSWGWNSFYMGYGWNSWLNPYWGPNWGYNPWCPPVYYRPIYGYYPPVVIVPEPGYARQVTRGPRPTRGGNISGAGRTAVRRSARESSKGEDVYLSRARRAASRAQRISAGRVGRTSGTRSVSNPTSIRRDYSRSESSGRSQTVSNTRSTSTRSGSYDARPARSSSGNTRSYNRSGTSTTRSSGYSNRSSSTRSSSGSSRSSSGSSSRTSSSRSSSRRGGG